MDHTGHRERLRQRFDQNGLNGFAEHEVLELLLTYAIPRVDVNPLAHRLVNRFGSLAGVLEASAGELKQVPGMGERSAALVSMMLPLLKRYQQAGNREKLRIETYSGLASYCAALFIGSRDEHFYLLCFDAKMQLIRETLMGAGTVDAVHVSPKMVVQEALRANAVSVAVAHNHPSGNPYPSPDDVELTRGIREALALVDVRFIDHVVVGAGTAFSLKRNDLVALDLPEMPRAAAESCELKGKPGLEIVKCREEEDFICW